MSSKPNFANWHVYEKIKNDLYADFGGISKYTKLHGGIYGFWLRILTQWLPIHHKDYVDYYAQGLLVHPTGYWRVVLGLLILHPTEYWRIKDLLRVHLRVLEVGTRVTVVGALWAFFKNDLSVIWFFWI